MSSFLDAKGVSVSEPRSCVTCTGDESDVESDTDLDGVVEGGCVLAISTGIDNYFISSFIK